MTAGDDASEALSGRVVRYLARPAWERELLAAVGHRIRSARKAQSMTLRELAAAAAVDASFLGELERGRETISISALALLAACLRVHVRELLPGEGDPAPSPSRRAARRAE